jgi:hypothetical protein
VGQWNWTATSASSSGTASPVRSVPVVGGYAVAAHGHPRFTKDLDLWIRVDPENARRLLDALDDFGFGSLGPSVADFAQPDVVVQLGQPPKRIDLLTGIDGVTFEAC